MVKSPFPTGFLGVDLEYDGVWNSVGTDLDQEGVSVAHGARSEGGTADVSSLEFRVKNGDGKYSPRNPNSALYGKIGRNTPARATAALGAPWLNFEESVAAWATTPDTAALSITGDIDLRWHGRRDSWASSMDVVSKYVTTSNQRSYLWRFEEDGTLAFFWSTDGVTLLSPARSTASIPPWAGEIALRVTLDVNNGASGRTIRFYYADDLAATWIQLGEDVVQAGTTSIFNSTAETTIGKNTYSAAGTPPVRVYGWEIRNGIGGTLVSSRNISDLAVTGAATFADVQGNTWTMTNSSVTNRHTLAVAEVAEWPIEWDRKGAPSAFTNVEASGVTRRLGQGAQPIDSPIYRAITTATNPNLKAYWPMEEGEDADSFAPAIRGTRAGWVGAPDRASYAGFGGSKPLPVLRTTRVRFRVPAYADTDQVQARFLFHKPSSGWSSAQTICEVHMQSFGLESVTLLTGATPGHLRFLGRDSDGVQLFDSTTTDWDVEDRDVRVSIELTQDGADTDWRVSVDGTNGFGLELTGTLVGTGFGRCTSVLFNPNRNDMDVAIGHLTVESSTSNVHDVPVEILNGYQGESSRDRISRLCSEHDIVLYARGRDSGAVPMGPQPSDTFLAVVEDAAAADGGLLHDNPVALGLRMRRLHSMGSQSPVTIPYTDNLVIPFEPSDDDALTRNRVAVDTPRGARAVSEATSGALSTLAPPDGVGLYEESLTLNLNTDDMVDRHADWAVHVGTWDEGRYPTLGVDLAHPTLLANSVLTREVLSLSPGDRLVITNPPTWLPPTSVDVLVMGVQVDVTPLHVRLTWTCVPARPYKVGYWNHPQHRWSAAGTVLTSSVTTTGTSLSLTVPDDLSWTHADGDYDITIGGELMTVTNVVGTTMTVTRSVNGVVKAHSAGAAVALAEPSFYPR